MQRGRSRLDSEEIARAAVLAAAGDEAARKDVLESAYDYVRTILYRMVGASNELEDLQQTVLVRIVQSLPRYRADGKLSSWISGICVHVVRDHWRRRKVREVITYAPDVEEMVASQPDVSDRLEARRMLHTVTEALEQLSPNHRTVFVLKTVFGHSTQEIAELTGSAHSTTRLRLYYARKALAKVLKRLRPYDASLDLSPLDAENEP